MVFQKVLWRPYKTFWGTTKKFEKKIYVNFLSSSEIVTGRVKDFATVGVISMWKILPTLKQNGKCEISVTKVTESV